MSFAAALVATSLLSNPALAQDDDTGPDPSLPIPTLKYDRPPPDYSYEFGIQMSYGTITYWQQEVAPWIGFGFRVGWGRNIPETYRHRIGLGVLLFAEGPIPVHMTLGLEPHLTWDWIGKKGLLVGAGVGPSALYHSKIDSGTNIIRKPGFGASAAARIGWSQTWSRVGRRLYIAIEPKIRLMDGPNGLTTGPTAQLVIGSGKGY
ncbi:MAG: hypothetical protein H6737_29180 [Alphaproteobacteria bacterium]|nr:hypothetical protein [Alphaproteobacteria bacterium]